MRNLVGTALLVICLTFAVSCDGSSGIFGDCPSECPAIITLVPDQPSYEIGDTVVVRVEVENAINVYSLAFHLLYDVEVAQFLIASEGDFLADAGNTILLADDPSDNGEVVLGHSIFGPSEGASGAGTFSLLHFEATGPGDCAFVFSEPTLLGETAQALPAVFHTRPVTINE